MSHKNTKKQALHVQLSGMAMYDEENLFAFYPDNSVEGLTSKFCVQGVALQMSNGTFEFVPRPKKRPASVLIKKLAHGRLSATKDGAIQLTLKVFKTEGVDIKKTILKEAKEAFE